MRYGIIGGVLGYILCTGGITILTWQFWVVMLLVLLIPFSFRK